MGLLTSVALRVRTIVGVAASLGTGCSSLADDCDNLLCAPENCEPAASGGAVGGLCGVFVSSETGDDAAGNGSQERPFKTLGAALAAPGGKPIYACAGPPYEEALELSSSSTLFGGLDCATWAYAGTERRSVLVAPPDQIAVRVLGAAAIVRVEDFDITASDVATPGASSIAMLVDAATVSLARVGLSAGNGGGGASVPHAESQAMNGAAGQGGMTGCVSPAIAIAGGAGGSRTCNGIDVSGGDGGEGKFSVAGGTGAKGKPVTEVGGSGGKGEDGSACANGGVGSSGDDGDDGVGAVGMGSLDATGYVGVAGSPGADGTPGQGGGGGGGGATCNGNAGPSGGGGGSGGCGGLGGPGGGSGGASIALISLQAAVTLVEVSLRAGNGGNGGDGQPGQTGGVGGTRGSAGGLAACDGGYGASGGDGGAGGGGMGGPSIGIAYTGAPPQEPGAVTTALGAPGQGGLSGTGSQDPPGAGVAGVAAERQQL